MELRVNAEASRAYAIGWAIYSCMYVLDGMNKTYDLPKKF